MVCPRCVSAVTQVFNEMSLSPLQVQLGEIQLEKELSEAEQKQLKEKLEVLGFELLDDGRKKQIEKIKTIIIEHIHHLEDDKFIFSEIIAEELNREYSQLSKLFSATEGITIERYVILQKTEKVKELLVYNQLNLSEIADKMGYSSVAHLSSQFKKTTGMPPSEFKAMSSHNRKSIDGL